MTDSTRRGPSIYGVKTTKTKRRGNIVKSFALIAWITLATAEAQNIAPTPTRLSMFGMQGQPTAPTRELPALPGQQPIHLYFFSGPDFLYADTFYPDCNTYVLVSLESVESIPELQSVPLALLQNTLQNIEVSLNTILNVGYFETQDLREYSQRSQLKGILPLIFVFLARSGKEILNVDFQCRASVASWPSRLWDFMKPRNTQWRPWRRPLRLKSPAFCPLCVLCRSGRSQCPFFLSISA